VIRGTSEREGVCSADRSIASQRRARNRACYPFVMESREFWQLDAVSDTRLRSGLVELLAVGYRTEARIIAHLAEVELRKLHLRDGSPSLFDYCTRVLHLSNSEAFHRITAARIARRFPVVFELIERRELHLTAVCLLRDYLTPENHQELLAEAAHKTKGQVEELLARRFPRPDVESRIRKLPPSRALNGSFAVPQVLPCWATPTAAPPAATMPAATPLTVAMPAATTPTAAPPAATTLTVAMPAATTPTVAIPTAAIPTAAIPTAAIPTAAIPTAAIPTAAIPTATIPTATIPTAAIPTATMAGPSTPSATTPRTPQVPSRVEPLSEARYRIQLNASATLKEKLERLRALTRHSNPSGDIAVVIERALDVALEKAQRQRFAETGRPRIQRAGVAQASSGPSAVGVDRAPSPESAVIAESDAAPRRRRVRAPNAVLREIVKRDGLQCSYVGANGCRCTARGFLEVHHEWPWARGGGETVDNLRLLCAAHNRLLAERDFGVRHVELRRSERFRKSESVCETDG